MPFDETNKGDPFRGDFPDWPDKEPWRELAEEVQRQADELARRRYEPKARQDYLRLLKERRRKRQEKLVDGQPGRRADRKPDGTVTQFDFLPVQVGYDTLLVPGELLITHQSYYGEHGRRRAKESLDALHIEATDVHCHALRDRVLRLTPSAAMEPQDRADVSKVLRTQEFEVSLSSIIPTAGVQKPPPDSPPPPPPSGSAVQQMAEVRAQWSGRGRPVKVAIIDTGITPEMRTDGRLDTVPRGARFNDPLDVFPLPAGDGFLDFDAGHGTFVAGCVDQIAPGAQITVYRATDTDGIASEVTVACEMIRAVKGDGAQIVNLSLGCQTQDDAPPIAIQAALEIIREWERETGRDVLVVAAAGNYADTRPCWPAAFREVVSVGGLAPDMQPTAWSTRGFWVTCSTIGQGIVSTYVEGRESPQVDPKSRAFGPNAWAVWIGTSFAAPQITGALARLSQDEGISVRDALRKLLAAGRPIPDFGQALRILPGI